MPDNFGIKIAEQNISMSSFSIFTNLAQMLADVIGLSAKSLEPFCKDLVMKLSIGWPAAA